MHIHAHHMQVRHRLNRLADAFLRVIRRLLDGRAVLHDDIQIHAGFFGADFHLHALGHGAVLAQQIAGDIAHTRNALHLAGSVSTSTFTGRLSFFSAITKCTS